MKSKSGLLTSLLFIGALAACGRAAEQTPLPATGQPEVLISTQAAEPTQDLPPESTSTLTPTPSPTPVLILEPGPIEVKFKADDGEELAGVYYPGSENPAPVIVLMHWARGDQTEWEPIARWLQGRGTLNRQPDYNHSWTSSTWYPERELDLPLGVFSFTFRDCQEECQAYLPSAWLLDAEAALRTAAALPGADPERILTAGASIGADGALGSCVWLNETELGRCRGSFGLSPASLLTQSYAQNVAALHAQLPDAPVYCLYGLRDDASVDTCESRPDLSAIDYGYVDYHGMELIQPDRGPDPLALLEEFIQAGLGEEQ